MIEYKNKILSAFKNRQRSKEHRPNSYVVSIHFEGIFFLYYRRVLFLETSFYSYVLRFLNKFSIHVPIKKLEFKCDGSLHSFFFCRFLQTFVYHKICEEVFPLYRKTTEEVFLSSETFLYGLYCE